MSARARKRGTEPCKLLLVPPHRPDAELIGLQAVPGRMPTVMRLPGEDLKALMQRALHYVTGCGPLLVYPLFQD